MSVGNIATSGLKAALTNMESISNNIANVNTVGFKKSFVNFSDIYMGSIGSGSQLVGLGTRVQSVKQDFSTGRVESSSRGLDLRLARDGFLVQKNQGSGLVSYTRAGRLDFDKDGYLMGTGGAIQGFPALDGKILNTGNLVNLQVGNTPIPAKPTQKSQMTINLNSKDPVIASTFSSTDPTTYNYRTDETIYDSLGNSHIMSMYYVKSSDNNWTAHSLINDNEIGQGALSFNEKGVLSSTSGLSGLAWTPGQGALSPQLLDIDMTGSSQFAGEHTTFNHEQDGCPSGAPLGCAIDTDGKLNVYYSNGKSRVEGQIALAQFRTPQELAKADNMSWLATSTSGTPLINSEASQGAIICNSIEYSNVDLTEELVRLIGAQHDFQANAQVQQTYNQVLQTIENL